MDIYTENNGFQVIEGATPFDEDGQIQETDSLPVAPYQEIEAEYGAETYMDEVDALPIESGQMAMPETEDPELYQDAALGLEGTDMEQEEILPAVDEIGQTAEPETAEVETAPAVSEEDDEETKRAEHEAAEARCKAEWEEKQRAKRTAEQAKLDQLAGMSDDEAVSAAMKRVGADTERLTRRNMKDCVTECIQTKCLEDSEFARMVMHPRKNMVNCFHYINRKAREFIEQEMEDNDIRPENGVYGSDVPDDLCYQWAEDYFRDPDAKEDEVKEEKFVPKPYVGKTGSKTAAKKKTDKKEKKEKKAPEKKPETEKNAGNADITGQLSLLDMMAQGSMAS